MSGTADSGDPYGVDFEADNEFHGYAWSSNVGWLKFGDGGGGSALTGCPAGSCNARLNTTTGELEGWARFCSATESIAAGTPYDVTFNGEDFDLSAYMNEDNARAVVFNNDGTELFLHSKLGSFLIDRFELGTPYDVSTAVWAEEVDMGPVSTNVEARIGIKFNNDGTRLYVPDWGAKIHQYDLAIPYDVSTAGPNTFIDLSAYATRIYEFEFINGGSSLVAGASTPDLSIYSLSTPFDVTTATHVSSIDLGIAGSVDGLEFSSDGSTLFIIDDPNILKSYALSTPFDVTTATYIEQTTVPTGDFWSLHMHNGGLKATGLVRSGTDRVVTFDLGEPWDLVGTTVTPAIDCSNTLDPDGGGWDGWVSLNCSNTGDCGTVDYKWEINSGLISGYAWGGDVVGWLYANDIDSGFSAPTASIGVRTAGSADPLTTVSPYSLTPGEEIEIEWDSTDADECLSTNGPGFSTGSATDGTDNTVTEPTVGTAETYTVVCSGTGGNSPAASIIVEHIASNISVWAEPVLTEQNTAVMLFWDVTGHDPSACDMTGPNGFNFTLSTTTGSQMSDPIEGESDYTLTCGPNGINPQVSEDLKVRITATGVET